MRVMMLRLASACATADLEHALVGSLRLVEVSFLFLEHA
jgi:hypothetical protein